jgi:uncharacterized protein (TIGR04255 family)
MSDALEVQPAAGKHAIEVMALAVEWDRQVAPETLLRVEELYRDSEVLRRLLPRLEKMRGLSVQLAGGGMSVNADDAGGLQLTEVSEQGSVTWAVSVRPDLVACSCFTYDRWDSVKPRALEMMGPIVERVLESGCEIQAIGLQYQDSFRVLSGSPLHAAKRLFRESNDWMNSHVWRTDGSWHIHQGWFSASSDGRRVHNLLNVDFIGEADVCIGRINGQHRVQAVDRNGRDPRVLSPSGIAQSLDGLHLDNKRALHNLLSNDVCRQIGLTVPEET